MRANRRHAFTLVELLVVIAIIGILIALLLPAVQQIRELARRMQCQGHMREIATAMEHHHESKNSFPPGLPQCRLYNWHSWSTNQGAYCNGLSWAQAVLDELGERTLYDAFYECMEDQVNACDDCEHQVSDVLPGRTTPQIYICPSADRMTKWLGRDYDPPPISRRLERLAKGNYVACFGWGSFIPEDPHYLGEGAVYYSFDSEGRPQDDDRTQPAPKDLENRDRPLVPNDKLKTGVFRVVMLAEWEKRTMENPATRQQYREDHPMYDGRWKMGFGQGTTRAQITDGMSKTMFLSEILGWDSHADSRGCWQCGCIGCSTFTAKYGPNAEQNDRLVICDDFPDTQPDPDDPLRCDEPPALRGQKEANHNSPSDKFDATINDVWASARSRHSGGVVVAYAGGQVGFIQDSVDIYVWRAMSTAAGQEQAIAEQ